MHRLKVILPLLLISLLACKQRVSRYRLSDGQLAHLMVDLTLGEAALTGLDSLTADSLRTSYVARMQEIYGLTEEELNAEVKKLELDPDKMNAIMGRIRNITDSIR